MKLLIAALVLLSLPGLAATEGPDFDLDHEAPYCQAAEKKFPQIKDVVTPDWKAVAEKPLTPELRAKLSGKNPRLRQALQGPLSELAKDSHQLNQHYLENIHDSAYHRLAAARVVGIDFNKFARDLEILNQRCSTPDVSGQTFQQEAKLFTQLPIEVEKDAMILGPQSLSQETYLRQLTVAALETKRLKSVLKFMLEKLKYGDFGPQTWASLKKALSENERRLIRLQYAFPVVSDLKSDFLITALEASMVGSELTFGDERVIFASAPNLEQWLEISPPAVSAPAMGSVPLAGLLNAQENHFYENLYRQILGGQKTLLPVLRTGLINAVEQSVHTSLHSAGLKCANPSPCSAIAIDKDRAQNLMIKAGHQDFLGPLACSCHLGATRETVNGQVNLYLGLSSAAAVVGSLLQPELAPLVWTAYGLAYADMGAAATGMIDGIDNYGRTLRLAGAREGGATSSEQQLKTKADLDQSGFELLYDLGTGVIGLLPPAKMSTDYAGIKLRQVIKNSQFIKDSGLEFAKGVTGAPCPDLTSEDYSENWQPNRLSVPVPNSVAQTYPKLYLNLQKVAGLAKFSDAPGERYEILAELKEGIEVMITNNDPLDLELLKTGKVRSELCPRAQAMHLKIVSKTN